VDVIALHAVTEDLAAYLSEATVSDLGCPTPFRSWDLSELYLHLVEQNARIGSGIGRGSDDASPAPAHVDRTTLSASAHLYGGGFEEQYRRTARVMENAFAAITDPREVRSVAGIPGDHAIAELYEMQIRDALTHARNVAQALGLDYEPRS
jgi:hypothetical protein